MSGWVIDINNKTLYRHYKRFDGVYIRCCYIYYKNGYYIGVINSKKKKIYRSLSLEDLILKIDMILKKSGVSLNIAEFDNKTYKKSLKDICIEIKNKMKII